MITATSISGGETYLSKHLSANDYYAEGEKIEGQWIGEGAKRLGLEGAVDADQFEALRQNIHPETGNKLTARKRGANGVALHDITFSAPKAASIAAIVGGDDRVREAWQRSVKLAVAEIEKFAAVRLRTGEYSQTEKLSITGNVTGALFFHDASRSLDPQLHAHLVLANASYEADRGQWLALQRKAMMRASPYVREFLYHNFALRLKILGYEIESAGNSSAFGIVGITKEMEDAYSQRALQRQAFEQRYAKLFDHDPSKRRIEHFIKENKGAAEKRFHAEHQKAFGKPPTQEDVTNFVRDWRDPKLTEISTADVRSLQRGRITSDQLEAIQKTVADAQKNVGQAIITSNPHDIGRAAQMGLDHCLERSSVVELAQALEAALKFGSAEIGPLDVTQIHDAMLARPGVISDGNEITTEQVLEEEARSLRFASVSRGAFAPLGNIVGAKMDLLDGEQITAVEKLATNDNGVAVFIGDAGTGKTRALSRLSEAYSHAHGRDLVALAPTTRATAELKKDGHKNAATISLFLNSQRLQEAAYGGALLVDEAGILSSRQLAELVAFAEANEARLVLVGDTKQHDSVERGSALRSLTDSGIVRPIQLSKVRRQQSEEHKKLAKLLAAGRPTKALSYAQSLGMVSEIANADELFDAAAKRYADAIAAGRETLVVIPTWKDIETFNFSAREVLKERGLILGDEIQVRGSKSLSWTEVERCHWAGYKPGMVLNFHGTGAGVGRGESATVKRVLEDGIEILRPDKTLGKVTRKQRNTFDVAEAKTLDFAAGDAVLFQANCPEIKISNGDRLQVKSVDPETKRITLEGGKIIPDRFSQFCHGHAVTSHKSQGASVQESILVFGPESLGATNIRQAYVSNTRFKEDHHLFIHDLSKFKEAIGGKTERKLAREFVAELGKDLGTLLAESEKLSSSPNKVGAAEREAKIRQLLGEVATHERKAKTANSYQAFLKHLGAERLPKRIQKWIASRRRQRTSNHRSAAAAKSYANARSVRKARQAVDWWRRASAGARSAGRRL